MTTPALTRALLGLAFALALVVLGTSSGLRLAADGLGCDPWPRCYGHERARTRDAGPAPVERTARLAHRIAAGGFAAAAFAAVLLGWRRWGPAARAAGALLLVATAALAALGRITPSVVPAVTLGNVLGGLALLAGTAFLLASRVGAATRERALALPAAFALLLALQAASGAMISVRGAGAACHAGCAAEWPPAAHRLWHPLERGTATAIAQRDRAGDAMHAVHRLFAIGLIVAAAGAAARRGAGARPLLAALALSLLSGAALALSGGALGPAVVHALAAGALAATVGALLARGSFRMEAP